MWVDVVSIMQVKIMFSFPSPSQTSKPGLGQLADGGWPRETPPPKPR